VQLLFSNFADSLISLKIASFDAATDMTAHQGLAGTSIPLSHISSISTEFINFHPPFSQTLYIPPIFVQFTFLA